MGWNGMESNGGGGEQTESDGNEHEGEVRPESESDCSRRLSPFSTILY